jgi:hypothetical protein
MMEQSREKQTKEARQEEEREQETTGYAKH